MKYNRHVIITGSLAEKIANLELLIQRLSEQAINQCADIFEVTALLMTTGEGTLGSSYLGLDLARCGFYQYKLMHKNITFYYSANLTSVVIYRGLWRRSQIVLHPSHPPGPAGVML